MPSSPLSPDFRDMLGLLLKHRVEFLIIGAHAVAAHGHPRNTGDMDLLVRPSPENAERLWNALIEFGAPLKEFTREYFTKAGHVAQFGVPPLRIDFTTSLTGIKDFDQAWQNHIVVHLDGMALPVLGKAEVIRNKRASGRPKDLADVDALEDKPSNKPKPR